MDSLYLSLMKTDVATIVTSAAGLFVSASFAAEAALKLLYASLKYGYGSCKLVCRWYKGELVTKWDLAKRFVLGLALNLITVAMIGLAFVLIVSYAELVNNVAGTRITWARS